MVFDFTPDNILFFSTLIHEYEAQNVLVPIEFYKHTIRTYPEYISPSKAAWLKNIFIGIIRHQPFFDALIKNNEILSYEGRCNLMVIMYGIIFKIDVKYANHLYKSLFQFRNIIDWFFNTFKDEESLKMLSKVGSTVFDYHYVLEKIVSPLLQWLPLIQNMKIKYENYLLESEKKRQKLPTIPVSPKFALRPQKKVDNTLEEEPEIETPPQKQRPMLTKSAIDKKLQEDFKYNRERAQELLAQVKQCEQAFANGKSEKYYERISEIQSEMENNFKPIVKPNVILPAEPLPFKQTKTTLKRVTKLMEKEEKQEVNWLDELLCSCSKSYKIEQLEKEIREIKEKERLEDIEKKHLMGQISYEEAIIAKKKVLDDNKIRYLEIMKEKEIWKNEIEDWKQKELEKQRQKAEKLSLLELHVAQAKDDVLCRNKKRAEYIKEETKFLIEEAMKKKKKELERQINLIRQIKILSALAKETRAFPVFDFTETAGFGFLSEMSISELQERLMALKMDIKEQREQKRKEILKEKAAAEEDLEQTKKIYDNYLQERSILKKIDKSKKIPVKIVSTEINDLKKQLEEKRKLRQSLAQI